MNSKDLWKIKKKEKQVVRFLVSFPYEKLDQQAVKKEKRKQRRHERCSLAVQSCLTLCNPMDCSPPGSSFHGIFQATIHALLRGSLPHPGIEPGFPALQADSLLGGQWKDIHEMEEK